MIKHIVCFKLKDNSEESKKNAQAVLLGMRGKVEQLIDIAVGIDFLKSERSYDVILETVVKDREALDAYQNHPYHVEVVKKYMHATRSASISVDYEF